MLREGGKETSISEHAETIQQTEVTRHKELGESKTKVEMHISSGYMFEWSSIDALRTTRRGPYRLQSSVLGSTLFCTHTNKSQDWTPTGNRRTEKLIPMERAVAKTNRIRESCEEGAKKDIYMCISM